MSLSLADSVSNFGDDDVRSACGFEVQRPILRVKTQQREANFSSEHCKERFEKRKLKNEVTFQ